MRGKTNRACPDLPESPDLFHMMSAHRSGVPGRNSRGRGNPPRVRFCAAPHTAPQTIAGGAEKPSRGQTRRKRNFPRRRPLLYGPGYFSGTQAAGASVHALGGSVNDCLDPTDIGLPGTVGMPHRVGNLAAKRHALAAEFTFCHICTSLVGSSQSQQDEL